MTDIAELMKSYTAATEERLEKSDTHYAEIKKELKAANARADDIERKANRGTLGVSTAEKTVGQKVIESDALSEMCNAGSNGLSRRVEVKAITNASGSGGALHAPDRDTAVLMPRRPITIRDLLRVVQVGSNDVEYAEQTTAARNAAGVAEGAQKPESAMAFELKTVKTVTIAHWVTASRQVLSDAPQLSLIHI